MISGLFDATPILMLIVLGVVIRLSGLMDERGGLVLTRLAYHVTIPASIFVGIARSSFSSRMLLLPAMGLGLPLLLTGIAFLTTKRLADRPGLRGVMMSGLVVNGVFGYAFAELFFGAEGLARLAMYDAGNTVYAGTACLWVAQHYGSHSQGNGSVRSSLKRVLSSPVLWAGVLGVAAAVLSVELPTLVGDFMDRLAMANTALVMIAVGIFVRPRAIHVGPMLQFLTTRLLVGGALAWGLGTLLGMRGLDMIAVLIGVTLPTGTTAFIYAGNEGLDAEFAASLVSITVVIGAIVINVLPHLLRGIYL